MLEQILNRLNGIDSNIKDLKQGQERIENKLNSMEAQNASQYTELSENTKTFSKDITFLEAVSGKNMADIAKIKLIM